MYTPDPNAPPVVIAGTTTLTMASNMTTPAFPAITKADIQAAIEILQKATADPALPPVYVVPSKEHAEALLDIFAGDDPRPRQEPLFVIPPPATPSGWTIEFRWRTAHDVFGRPQDTTVWNHVGTWRDFGRLKSEMRRLRYIDHWKRKEWRYRVTLWDYQGDITFNGPDEPKPAPSPAAPATTPDQNPVWLTGKFTK